MDTNLKIKKITDGAIITALYAVLFLASRFIGGLLEGYLYFLIPIPLIVYGYKYDLIGAITTSVAILVVSFLVIPQPISVLFYVLPGLIGGTIIPLIMKSKKGIFVEIGISSLISLVVNVLASVIFGYLFNYDIIEDTLLFVEQIVSMLNDIGLNNFSVTLLESLMVSILPSVLIITSLVEGFVIYLLSHMLLIRLKLESKFEFRSLLSIENCPTPVGIAYVFVAILMILSVFSIQYVDDTMFIICSIIMNIGAVYSLVMILQGIVYIARYSRLKNARWVYILAVISLFFCPFIVIIIGVIQNIFHISRKLY